MQTKKAPTRKNLFEIDNARNLSRGQMVDTFVPTESFWRLLSQKHHVILGSRGSGKTALAKMLSHDHLCCLDDPRAKGFIRNREYIGIYLPTRLEWVGALKNKPWQDEVEKEFLFQWRLNLSSCMAFLQTIESCNNTYIKGRALRARTEREICINLSEAWFEDGSQLETFSEVQKKLDDIHFRKHFQLEKKRILGALPPKEMMVGVAFETDLFLPLRYGIKICTNLLKISSETTWLVCIDEAEFLDTSHHKILNSHMRAYTDNMFFKITTMPYCHYTLDTNTRVSLVDGQDFEYVYIDYDRVLLERATNEINTIGTQFARKLFKKRADASGFTGYQRPISTKKRGRRPKGAPVEINLRALLGYSKVLDPKDNDWTIGSENMRLLEKYASDSTFKRAKTLAGSKKFGNEIARKIHGALILRDLKNNLTGNMRSDAYAGARMVVRCGDANPQRLIRIFNKMVLAKWKDITDGSVFRDGTDLRIPQDIQTAALETISSTTLSRTKSEPGVGNSLHEFMVDIGNYMHDHLHNQKLTTDQVSSIEIDKNISDNDWELIKRAVGLGLLYPNVRQNKRDELPFKTGSFRLAYLLAPHFFLLPRRGKPHKLSTIQKYKTKKIAGGVNNDIKQLSLFSFGSEE